MSVKIDWESLWKEFDAWVHHNWPMVYVENPLNRRVCRKVEELVCEQMNPQLLTEQEGEFFDIVGRLHLEDWLSDKGQELYLRWIRQQNEKRMDRFMFFGLDASKSRKAKL